MLVYFFFFFFSSRRRHTRCGRDWSSDVCSSDLQNEDYDMSKVEAFRRENFDYLDTGSADRVIDWLILNDPPGGGQPTSEPACRNPATAAVAARPSAANRGRKP